MISKNRIRFIKSLRLKKHRLQEGLFVAEGPKVVGDLLEIYPAHSIVATAEWIRSHAHIHAEEIIEVSEEELRNVSFLQHPQQVLALFPLPSSCSHTINLQSDMALALDGIQDPGNMGTIIRIADWFGIHTIYCSMETTDAYNPKVVQATMGSIARVNIVYTDLRQLISGLPLHTPVYGTMLDGESLYGQQLAAKGLLVMGNEGNGISEEIAQMLTHRLFIPTFPSNNRKADSLNVATATAIVCSELRRQAALL